MAAFRAQVAVHMGIFREESGWAMLCSLRDADVDFSTLQKVWKLEPPCWKLSPAKWHAASLAAYSLPISMLPCYLFWVSSRNIQQNWWLMIDDDCLVAWNLKTFLLNQPGEMSWHRSEACHTSSGTDLCGSLRPKLPLPSQVPGCSEA